MNENKYPVSYSKFRLDEDSQRQVQPDLKYSSLLHYLKTYGILVIYKDVFLNFMCFIEIIEVPNRQVVFHGMYIFFQLDQVSGYSDRLETNP